MFRKKNETKYDDLISKCAVLERQIEELKKEKKELELTKTLEEREIKHLVKLKEEKQVVEFSKQKLELQEKFQTKEMELLKKYQEDMIKLIQTEHSKIQDIYSKIMERLPNVNMEIKKRS